MHKVEHSIHRWWKYFAFLSLANVLLISGQMLRGKTPLPDYLAAFSLLGLYITLGLLFISAAWAFIIFLSLQNRFTHIETFSDGILFGVVIMSWANLFRMILITQGIQPPWLPSRVILLVSFIIGFVVFLCLKQPLRDWFQKMKIRATGLSAAAICFWLVSIVMFIYGTPRKTHPSLSPSIPLQPRPNIIVLILDSLTTFDMSLYGYKLKTTPYLEEFAQFSDVYEDAHSAGTGTAVNLPAVITGRYPTVTPPSQYGSKLHRSEEWLNLVDILRAHTYQSIYVQGGTIGPNFHHLENCFDEIIRAGPGWYLSGDPLSWTARINPSIWNFFVPRSIPMEWILPSPYAFGRSDLIEPLYGQTINYLNAHYSQQNEKPFFLYMHMLRPHAPYLANEFEGYFLDTREGLNTSRSQLPYMNFPKIYSQSEEPTVAKLRLRYDENIRKADEHIKEFMTSLKKENLFDSSLIIVMADHGASFEKGVVGYHSIKLLPSEHSIPLLIKYPHQKKGHRIPGLVSTVDITPTILDLLGLTYNSSKVDGKSLLKFDPQKKPDRTVFVCHAGEPHLLYSALHGNTQMTHHADGTTSVQEIKPGMENNSNQRIEIEGLKESLSRFTKQIEDLAKS